MWKATRSYRTYSIPGKTSTFVPEFAHHFLLILLPFTPAFSSSLLPLFSPTFTSSFFYCSLPHFPPHYFIVHFHLFLLALPLYFIKLSIFVFLLFLSVRIHVRRYIRLLFISLLSHSGAKGDCDFWISDLFKNLDGTEVRRVQLAKSTLLTSTLVPLGSFEIF